ncbi:DNA-binding protein [Epidermidibacterium keratini]|uniref:DNA-binding protein n=1 Tax=Epidermidibacterium keratini TaxID=1891644 RepID=A0A7L4YSC3_9ACTN|nr:OB-fold nucleic acid binding domain-containing protein [Epidermidibacterium keratini]QHC01962.1 DNA-binding protein [Epidermidibacterium keratini]
MTEVQSKGFLSRLVHRITTDADDLDAEELENVSAQTGTCKCSNLATGEEVVVSGRLRSVLYTPSERAPALTAELFDGSGSLRLVWLGQRRIPGIEPGRSITVRGRIAKREGEPAVYNPWYELTSG